MYNFMRVRASLIAILFFALISCQSDRLEVDVSNVDAQLSVDRFESELYETEMQEIDQKFDFWKEKYPLLMSSVNDVGQLREMRADSLYIDLYSEVKKQGNQEEIWTKIEEGFRHLRYYYPQLSSSRLITYISGLDYQYPILLVDSSIFVSADMFLGSGQEYYASFPQYIRYEFDQRFLPSKLFEEIGGHLMHWSLDDASLLNFMIAEGKKLYFAEACLYPEPDSLIIRYPSDKIEWCKQNEANMWTFFLEEDILFDTDPRNKDRFISPAPFSKFFKPIDQDSPGRVGAWIGWQIVSSYMNAHPEVSVEELMNNSDHRRIFKESKYKPI